MNSSSPYVVLYSPERIDFAVHSGGREVSDKKRPCLVTAVEEHRIRLAPMLTARKRSRMNPDSWSIVDYGSQGPDRPSHPNPDAATFELTLRPGRTRGWRPTSCFVWTRDGGEWVQLSAFQALRAQGKASVIDTAFELDAMQIESLRLMHGVLEDDSTGNGDERITS
ncbi:uncharacterized protein B0H18DRAFT_1131791 [Fomitopsis serialis]|uniref:uncharacterized protein n=1 Tax=Fomitopsis serialis TaxID=139415 RepID=UPI002008E48E|nr:uncharacterized protein B0H18DRAFT_1131791 [Neoantrodia serialis]KAH9907105.1 hypothetical protein B0H18DRAFT_1131791 [Neoantrodia serialis]